MSTPALLTTSELASRMHLSRCTVWRLSESRIDFRACKILQRSLRCWSVARLQAAGFLPLDTPAQVQEARDAGAERVLFLG